MECCTLSAHLVDASEKMDAHSQNDKLNNSDELAKLRKEVACLRASEKEHRRTRESLQNKTRALGERVKELNCIYALSSLVEKHRTSLERILHHVVEVMPSAWQYPEIAAAKVAMGANTFITANYRPSKWTQSADIRVRGEKSGFLQVIYLEERPQCWEGPFLKEERKLINSLAKRIGEIAERKLAEDDLKESMVRNKALQNSIPDLIFRIKKDGTILDFKKGKTLGQKIKAKKIIGRKIADLAHEYPFLSKDITGRGMTNIEQVFEKGTTQLFQHQYRHGSKTYYYEVLLTVSGRDEVLGIIRDMTEWRKLEKQVLEISEWEKQRIGQDLHDSLSQQLAGIAYLGKTLERKIAAKSFEEAKDANQIVKLIDDAIIQTKGLARGLYPQWLVGEGLMAAFSELADTVEKLFMIKCCVEYDQLVPIDDDLTAMHLYRIAQEAVNNAIKHSLARNITISFRNDKNQTVLTIRNDGIGFKKTFCEGMGMKIMRYRANSIHASLEIRSNGDGETAVICTF
ncbi:MAG: PAS domain-containing protein [Syntrophorhabdus sp.]|nr:PAS domain-containing protein [Syntrophorhabdus sp.]